MSQTLASLARSAPQALSLSLRTRAGRLLLAAAIGMLARMARGAHTSYKGMMAVVAVAVTAARVLLERPAVYVTGARDVLEVPGAVALAYLVRYFRSEWDLDAWIALTDEAAIDPNRRIIDPHHHLWDYFAQPKGRATAVPWFFPKLRCLFETVQDHAAALGLYPSSVLKTFSHWLPMKVPYMRRELLLDIRNKGRGHNIVDTVYIECGWEERTNADGEVLPAAMWPAGEVAAAAAERRGNDVICTKVVPFAQLELGAAVVEPLLEFYSRQGCVAGIRRAISCSPSAAFDLYGGGAPGVTRDPKFREAFALLKKYNLTYDTWLYQNSIDDLRELAEAFPKQVIVCDHVGGPLGCAPLTPVQKVEYHAQWRESITQLARCPNVYVKLSGLNMAHVGLGFEHRPRPPTSDELATAIEPYITHCIAAFGVDRCMFASNFPVDKITSSYTVLFNAFKKLVRGRPEAEQDALFYGTAAKVYKIGAFAS